MAKVIIGGQMLSLILALVVTPVFYILLDALSHLTRRLGFRLSVGATPHPRTRHRLHHRPGGEPEELERGSETAEQYVT
jgi:hypothetical protein